MDDGDGVIIPQFLMCLCFLRKQMAVTVFTDLTQIILFIVQNMPWITDLF